MWEMEQYLLPKKAVVAAAVAVVVVVDVSKIIIKLLQYVF